MRLERGDRVRLTRDTTRYARDALARGTTGLVMGTETPRDNYIWVHFDGAAQDTLVPRSALARISPLEELAEAAE